MKVKALKNKVLVQDLESGERVINGIVVPDDNGKSEGIRARWGKVYSVGDNIDEVKPGQFIYVKHGRWTRAFDIKQDDGSVLKLWGVEWPDAVMLVADEIPDAVTFSEWSRVIGE